MSTPDQRDLFVKTLSADSPKVTEGILLGSLGLTTNQERENSLAVFSIRAALMTYLFESLGYS